MYDLFQNLTRTTVPCLDKGFVTLRDSMPRLVPDEYKTADHAIAAAARVSYAAGTKTINEDRGLIRYLLRHRHTSPIEQVVFQFHLKMPIFVARQAVRHRMASLNEISGRYSVLREEFYFPEVEQVHQQSTTNKQGGEVVASPEIAGDFLRNLVANCDRTYADYQDALAKGISREQARMGLPVNLYTEWIWKIDLHNLLHFLSLRADAHAQFEIRVFAEAILELIRPFVPATIEAWDDYHPYREAVNLSRLEVEALRQALTGMKLPNIASENKREQAEWAAKAAQFMAEIAV